jgi:hypothetical protein
MPLGVWLISLTMLAQLLILAGGYGFHRDEMYFILAGRHPDWGYVDQPPLTPLLSAAAVDMFGLSPLAVRVAPAVSAAIVVLLAADMTRRLAGSRRAQVLAALVLAVSGLLGAGHLDVTVTYDFLFWTLALWLFVQLLPPVNAGEDRRWRWLALGLVVGIALQNKTLAIALPASAGAGVLLARRFDLLREPWPWIAAAIATAISWRPLGFGFLLVLGLMLVVNGKSYYSAGYLPVAVAAGAIPLAGWFDHGSRAVRRGVFAVATVASGLTVALIMLPLVPPADLHSTPIPDIYAESAAQVGWPELARQVEVVVNGLPADERQSALIVTTSYGQYGALTLLGNGLPPV